MNINQLLFRCKKELGLGKYLKTQRTDAELVNDIILPISRKDFSRFFKNIVYLNNVMLEPEDTLNGIYRLPLDDNMIRSLEHFDMEIKGIYDLKRCARMYSAGVSNMQFMNMPRGSFFGDSYGLSRIGQTFEAMSITEQTDFGYKHEFLAPYYIRFIDHDVDYSNILMNIAIFTTHPNNLSSIGDNIGLPFETLVKLDLKRILWNSEFKFINGMETQFNQIDFKIDDWGEAEAQRIELLKEFEDARISVTPMSIV